MSIVPTISPANRTVPQRHWVPVYLLRVRAGQRTSGPLNPLLRGSSEGRTGKVPIPSRSGFALTLVVLFSRELVQMLFAQAFFWDLHRYMPGRVYVALADVRYSNALQLKTLGGACPRALLAQSRAVSSTRYSESARTLWRTLHRASFVRRTISSSRSCSVTFTTDRFDTSARWIGALAAQYLRLHCQARGDPALRLAPASLERWRAPVQCCYQETVIQSASSKRMIWSRCARTSGGAWNVE
jgi:hypothetical protein